MSESDLTQAHSPMGPSAAARWMNCTASVEFTKGMDDTTSIFAAEGTVAHELSEWARLEAKPCKSYIGREVSCDGFDFVIDTEMAGYVQEFVDYCEQWPGDDFVEARVHYTAWVPDGWGTADDIRIVEDEKLCRLTDLKYGKGVQVYARHNTQLMLYALGVLQDFGHVYDIERFVLAIHQPRLSHVDEWEITVKDLLNWAAEIVRPAAAEAVSGEGKFLAGSWCRFCPGRDVCKERANQYISDFEALTDVDSLSYPELAEALAKVPEIKAWCSDIEKRAMSAVQRGEPVGDYKLVAGRSRRDWRDAEAAEAALRKIRSLKVADILPTKLVSPAQAEKLLGKKHPVLVEHIEVIQGKPVLAPGSDKRPPIQAVASEEFDSLD